MTAPGGLLDPYYPSTDPRRREGMSGLVWMDGRFPAGEKITTTAVAANDGVTLTTRSGSIYGLGRFFESEDDALNAGVIERWGVQHRAWPQIRPVLKTPLRLFLPPALGGSDGYRAQSKCAWRRECNLRKGVFSHCSS